MRGRFYNMKEVERELLKVAKRLLKGARFTQPFLTKDENDFIFVVKDEDDEYNIGVSVFTNPKLGYQILRDHMSKNDAKRVLRQLENKWKQSTTLQFEVKGEGHQKKYKKKRVAKLDTAEELVKIVKSLLKE